MYTNYNADEEGIITHSRADFDALLGVSMAKVDMFIYKVYNVNSVHLKNPFKYRGRPRKDIIYAQCPFCKSYRVGFKYEPEIKLLSRMNHSDDCVWSMAYEIIEKCPAY